MGGKSFLALDAGIQDGKNIRDAVKLDIKYNRILFEFPEGLATLPLIEECRALNELDNFDLMYDITMQLITGKPVFIYVKDEKGEKHLLDKFMCVDRHMDLRGVEAINNFPVIVNWMVEFMAELLSKKYPRLSADALRPTVSEPEKPKKKSKPRQS